MYKISIYGCAMFKKLVCQWVKKGYQPRSTVVKNEKDDLVRD